jgi:hypothetical protein
VPQQKKIGDAPAPRVAGLQAELDLRVDPAFLAHPDPGPRRPDQSVPARSVEQLIRRQGRVLEPDRLSSGR